MKRDIRLKNLKNAYVQLKNAGNHREAEIVKGLISTSQRENNFQVKNGLSPKNNNRYADSPFEIAEDVLQKAIESTPGGRLVTNKYVNPAGYLGVEAGKEMARRLVGDEEVGELVAEEETWDVESTNPAAGNLCPAVSRGLAAAMDKLGPEVCALIMPYVKDSVRKRLQAVKIWGFHLPNWVINKIVDNL